MTRNPAIDAVHEHEETSALIPWYVNDTIGDADRQKVESHLPTCARCREDLLQERRVYEQMATDVGVEYMPAPSLKRFQAQLDKGLAGAPGVGQPANVDELPRLDELPRMGEPPANARSRRRSISRRELMAASIAAGALVIGLLAAGRWTGFRIGEPQPNYYTVTTAATSPAGEVIRAVFTPSLTLNELQAILDESQLRIVSGPTEAGVYSLAATSPRSVNSSLAILRRHSTVRFAESTQPLSESGATR